MTNNLNEEYGYDKPNMQTEDRLTPVGLKALKQLYPGCKLKRIKSYTKSDKSTKELQDDHIDTIMIYEGEEYLIDFKTLNSDVGYYNCVIIELYRQWTFNFIETQPLEYGWIEASKYHNIPLERQLIVQVCDKQIFIYNKADAHRVINKYKSDFHITNLSVKLDKGNKRSDLKKGKMLHKYNKYLNFRNYRHRNILLDMNTKKYHLLDGKWKQVRIEDNY